MAETALTEELAFTSREHLQTGGVWLLVCEHKHRFMVLPQHSGQASHTIRTTRRGAACLHEAGFFTP